MNRTSKSLNNIKFAILSQFVTTLLTFVTRTVMTWTLGIYAIALNGLFTEVIAVLSLTELGIGSAIAYNLYKPLAENDEEKISQLMTLFKKVYRIIAGVTLVLGTLICPFIQYLVNGVEGYSLGYIRLVYMLFVIQIAASYLFSYKVTLLSANQKQYIFSLINTIGKVVGNIVMLAILFLTKNYILYLIMNILTTLGINAATSFKADKIYPYLHDAQLPKEEVKQVFSNVKNIFIKSLSGKITNSTDNILISVLVNTLQVGYYSYYAMVVSVFKQLLDQLEGSINSSVGNLFATENNERCILVLNRLTWMHGMLGIFVCSCIYACMETFITLWMGKDFLLGYFVLFVICINLFLYISCKPVYTAIHMTGEFEIGRNISIAGSVANLVVSIVLGIYMGIAGIFLGTVATYVLQIVLKSYYIYKLRFKCSPAKYAMMWIKMSVLLVVSMLLSNYLASFITTGILIADFIIYGLIGTAVSGLIIVIVYSRTEEFKYTLDLAKKILLKKA